MLTQQSEILQEIERRRFDLSLVLLKIYNYYRVFVGLSLLVVFSQPLVGTRLGDLSPNWFLAVTIGYTLFNLAAALVLQLIPRHWFNGQWLSGSLVAVDILLLTWLMYLSGGVASGIGALTLVAVAAGAIVVTGRMAIAMAALASIAVLYEEFYLSLAEAAWVDDYFQAGVLGMLYFGAAIAIQGISRRVRQNDIRALTQAAELADLERINRQIIQRMRTGIVLVDADDRVRMTNLSARTLLGVAADTELSELPEPLLEHLSAWREDTALRTPPFQVNADTPEIRANFSAVRANDSRGDVTIFIEDTGEIQQQAQQLKLAALGRLSASIAHEIRNPLGAISHAAQLLSESKNLDRGDERLTNIIHDHCRRMNGVIENVLENSRRRTPAPVRLSLLPCLEEFRARFSEAEPDARIDITVEPADTEVRIDRSQLLQVLNNLVGNAIRYSREATGTAWALLEAGVDPVTERPYLNVIDRGRGVDEQQLGNLFEPFFTTEAKGTGLGLYLSRELCEANQARLNYHRSDDQRSCFRITFSHPDRITG